jgi:hypothetical protein
VVTVCFYGGFLGVWCVLLRVVTWFLGGFVWVGCMSLRFGGGCCFCGDLFCVKKVC